MSDFPRTMKVRDLQKCAFGFVSIRSYDSDECFFQGTVYDIPFVYLDCWVAGLRCSSYHDKEVNLVRSCFLIYLES